MSVSDVFRTCVQAIREGELIVRENRSDKEFHFQNWFQARLKSLAIHFEQGGRNSFPDFSIVAETDGYELKGLAYPGRDASFDSNSQVPTGYHNGRTVYYVFGRYPSDPDGNRYPVLDLVICHGDFLNADHEYVHKNKSVKGFGSYGDLMIRDRKMYVVPTPFRIANGFAHQHTLVLPADENPGPGFFEVGALTRIEAEKLVVGYSFDLRSNELVPQLVANPGAGTEHAFRAWRLSGSPSEPVSLNGSVAASVADPEESSDD